MLRYKHTLQHIGLGLFTLGVVLFLGTRASSSTTASLQHTAPTVPPPPSTTVTVAQSETTKTQESGTAALTPLEREAASLQQSLRREKGVSVSRESLETALKRRNQLLERPFTLRIQREEQEGSIETYTLTGADISSWIRLQIAFGSARFRVVPEKITEDLLAGNLFPLKRPQHALLLKTQRSGSILRGVTEHKAQSGWTGDYEALAQKIAAALRGHRSEVTLPLQKQPGSILYRGSDGELHQLKLLAEGRSDFSGSPSGRRANIHKALNEHLNNVIIPPDELFSFNETLGGPVTAYNGWQKSLGIFNGGKEVRPVTGGGICQTSTTMYRAAAKAGLPLEEQRNHSLFVEYYKQHGLGMDATIFPGSQDLVFRNNTPHHLLVQAFTNGDKAIVQLYGMPDKRDVELIGPFVSSNTMEGFSKLGRPLRNNEVAWIQRITKSDGTTDENLLLSRYRKPLPSRILSQFQKAQRQQASL